MKKKQHPKTLKEFIKAVGITESAALFGKSPRTMYAWVTGDRAPRRGEIESILKITKFHPSGPVTREGIYT